MKQRAVIESFKRYKVTSIGVRRRFKLGHGLGEVAKLPGAVDFPRYVATIETYELHQPVECGLPRDNEENFVGTRHESAVCPLLFSVKGLVGSWPFPGDLQHLQDQEERVLAGDFAGRKFLVCYGLQIVEPSPGPLFSLAYPPGSVLLELPDFAHSLLLICLEYKRLHFIIITVDRLLLLK